MRAAILAILCFGLLFATGCSQTEDVFESDLPELSEATEKAEHAPLHDQIFAGMFHAKINMRYHLMEAVRWSWWDRLSRIATIILGLASFSGPLIVNKGRWAKWCWYGVGFASLIVTVAPFIWPFTEWTSQDTILSGRWNQLANHWYGLYEQQDGLEPDQTRDRIAELNKEAVEIENDENAARYDPEVMLAAENAEKEFQGIKKRRRSASAERPLVR